jgi:hypothetical protein
LSPCEREGLKRQLKDVVHGGSGRPSCREFGSPILFVRKSYDTLRICIDYRGLHEVTRKNACPLLIIDDTLDELKDANFYKYLHLVSWFWLASSRHGERC